MTETLEAANFGKRYKILDELGKGGMGVVFRALDRMTNQTVALKSVLTAPDQLLFASMQLISPTRSSTATEYNLMGTNPMPEVAQSSRGNTLPLVNHNSPALALINEFRTLATLRHPHIISVLDYGLDSQRRPYFTMQLLSDAKNIQETAGGLLVTDETRYKLLIQVLEALSYLHRRGIIHRDLKPGNILVMQSQVKVLDFGLSIRRERALNNTETVGTLAYMSPEVMRNEPVTEASDLYSFGVIAYQLLSGRYPYGNLDTMSGLIDEIMNQPPNVEQLSTVRPEVRHVLQRLLSKQPVNRYGSAEETISELCRAAHIDRPADNIQVRESFLQAADFIGREDILKELTESFQTATHGIGSVCLIKGASGSGKSRLMTEMQIRSMLEGMLVVKGQAIQDRQTSFHVWRQIIRRLALEVNDEKNTLSSETAGLLQIIEPDLSQLLGREIQTRKDLDGQSIMSSLQVAIVDLVSRYNSTLVILLEDLQWADDESLKLLETFTEVAPSRSVWILGNYRSEGKTDDELKKLKFLSDLPKARHKTLVPLTDAAIKKLCEAILGRYVGSNPDLLDLLQTETKGNVLFLLELIRVLTSADADMFRADIDAFRQSEIARAGVNAILGRRLKRLSEPSRDLLNIAAVYGRQIDVAILEKVERFISVENWLRDCEEAGILEIQEDRWQFAHDKLREEVLNQLSNSSKLEAIHRKIAQVIEVVYPQNHQALVHHWSESGDNRKSMEYAFSAGKQALEIGAYGTALQYLSRATMNLAQMPIAQQAELYAQLGQANLGLGMLADGETDLRKAAKLMGVPVPANSKAALLQTIPQLMRQLWHLRFGTRPADSGNTKHYELIGRIYEQVALVNYWNGQRNIASYAGLMLVNSLEKIPPTRELMRGYASLVVGMGARRQTRLAETYNIKLHMVAKKIDHDASFANALRITLVYYFGQAQWERNLEVANQAIDLAKKSGDYRALGDSYASYGVIFRTQGDLQKSVQIATDLDDLGQRTGNIQFRAWGQLGLMICATHRHDLHSAHEHMETGINLYREHKMEPGIKLVYMGPCAVVSLRRNDFLKAYQYADQGLAIISNTPPVVSSGIDGYSGVCETFLTLWEQTNDSGRYQEKCRQAVGVMQKFSKTFPVGKPRAALWMGLYHYISGNKAEALKTWEAGIHTAESLNIPLDKARLQREILRHNDLVIPDRAQYLSSLTAFVSDSEADYYLTDIDPN